METLAAFVRRLRDNLGLSAKGLAKCSNISLAEIEDIESGKELFLPVTIRQKLARALRCSLTDLAILERGYRDIAVDGSIIFSIKQQILQGVINISCPGCGAPLECRIAKMYDLDGNIVLEPRAHCTKCVFQIKD